jgi:hypothetical protein
MKNNINLNEQNSIPWNPDATKKLREKGYVKDSTGKPFFHKFVKTFGKFKDVNVFVNSDGTYQLDSNTTPRKFVAKDKWEYDGYEDKIIFYSQKVPTTAPIVAPQWTKCINWENAKYNLKNKKFEMTYSSGEINSFSENGDWNYVAGNYTETGKWKCLPKIGLIISSPKSSQSIYVNQWYTYKEMPIDYNSIKEVNGEIIGKYGGKDAKWDDTSKKWQVKKTITNNNRVKSNNNVKTNVDNKQSTIGDNNNVKTNVDNKQSTIGDNNRVNSNNNVKTNVDNSGVDNKSKENIVKPTIKPNNYVDLKIGI